jgi:hypothetical protein
VPENAAAVVDVVVDPSELPEPSVLPEHAPASIALTATIETKLLWIRFTETPFPPGAGARDYRPPVAVVDEVRGVAEPIGVRDLPDISS